MKPFILEAAKHAAEWFTIKVPEMKEQVNAVIEQIKSGTELTEQEKKIFGFVLFDYAMHTGPLIFFVIEIIADETGCMQDVAGYAMSWNNFEKNALL